MTGRSELRGARTAFGPEDVVERDIGELNQVFSDAFTERYRKDGMIGVRVPQLNPAIWRYAIADANGGAMLWRGDQGEIVAFNIAHCSGREGWMGPLAVRTDWQTRGVGKRIVRTGIDWLRARGAGIVGLETMPRTMDNIGFYSSLGFVPQRLTITLAFDGEPGDNAGVLLGRVHAASRDDALAECRALTEACAPGFDFSREIALTSELGLGDTALLREGGKLIGFALFHTAPLVEGRSRDELRVLKMVLRRETDITQMASVLGGAARRTGTRRVAMRMQGEYAHAYRILVSMGARVRWTDLRMSMPGEGGAEHDVAPAMVLSNWEI